MRNIDLTQEKLMELLSYDPLDGHFTWKKAVAYNVKAGARAGYQHPNGYVVIRIEKRGYFAHRLAWLYMHGRCNNPPHELLDHINRVKNDNRISNLRLASRSENRRNSLVNSNSQSGVKGVIPHRIHGKWKATICIDKKQIHLGIFSTIDEAKTAFERANLEQRK